MPVFYGQVQIVKKTIFVSRKGSGNEAFPEWNPQSGLCPFEEKGEFQGFFKSHSTAQQRPLGTVREANCLERVPLYRQSLKKGLKA